MAKKKKKKFWKAVAADPRGASAPTASSVSSSLMAKQQMSPSMTSTEKCKRQASTKCASLMQKKYKMSGKFLTKSQEYSSVEQLTVRVSNLSSSKLNMQLRPVLIGQ